MFENEIKAISSFGFPVAVTLFLAYKYLSKWHRLVSESKKDIQYMKKLHAWIMKLMFGIDLTCHVCHPPTYWKTERGKNVHRASHKELTLDMFVGMEKYKMKKDIAHKHVIKELSHSHNLEQMTVKDLHSHKHTFPTHTMMSGSTKKIPKGFTKVAVYKNKE